MRGRGEGAEVFGVVVGGQASRGYHVGIQLGRTLRRPRLIRALKVDQVQAEAGPANAFTDMSSENISSKFD